MISAFDLRDGMKFPGFHDLRFTIYGSSSILGSPLVSLREIFSAANLIS